MSVKISGCVSCIRTDSPVVVDANKVKCDKYLAGAPTQSQCKENIADRFHCPLKNTLAMLAKLPDLTLVKVENALNTLPISTKVKVLGTNDSITVFDKNIWGKTRAVLGNDGWAAPKKIKNA